MPKPSMELGDHGLAYSAKTGKWYLVAQERPPGEFMPPEAVLLLGLLKRIVEDGDWLEDMAQYCEKGFSLDRSTNHPTSKSYH